MPDTRFADAEDVLRVLGHLGESRVIEVLELRPTVAELIEARERVEQDGIPSRLRSPDPKVAELMRILDDDEDMEEPLVSEPSFADG